MSGLLLFFGVVIFLRFGLGKRLIPRRATGTGPAGWSRSAPSAASWMPPGAVAGDPW